MTEAEKRRIRGQARFRGIFDQDKKNGSLHGFRRRIALSSSAVCDECREYISRALEAGLDGSQARQLEEELARYIGAGHAVALGAGGSAMRLALKLAAERIYGSGASCTFGGAGVGLSGEVRGGSSGGATSVGCLAGKKVFCPDLTTIDMISPIVYEGGEPVFIDSSDEDWSMDPDVLELAFQKYPDTGVVVMNHVYGFPGQTEKIRQICDVHGAVLIECAGEALGAEVWTKSDSADGAGSGSGSGLRGDADRGGMGKAASSGGWKKAGSFGDYAVIDFHGDGIIGGSGEVLLVRDSAEAENARRLVFGVKESVPWNPYREAGYGIGISVMGEPDAALLRGKLLHLDEIIEKKKEIYERYLESLDGDLAYLIPAMEGTRPNYWVAAMTVESSIRFRETREGNCCSYQDIHGTAAPMEICDALEAFGAQAGPVYRPMSMQPVFQGMEYFTLDGPWRVGAGSARGVRLSESDKSGGTVGGGAAEAHFESSAAGGYYESGICLPGDAGMTAEEQEQVIEIVLACYSRAELDKAVYA